jgi:hypothetical protein
MVFVGTIVHADALLARLEQNPPKGWTIMKYVIEKDGVPLWPERLPMEEIMRIKDEYMLQGALPNFYMGIIMTLRKREEDFRFEQFENL